MYKVYVHVRTFTVRTELSVRTSVHTVRTSCTYTQNVHKCTYTSCTYKNILESMYKYRENSVRTKWGYMYVRSPYVRNKVPTFVHTVRASCTYSQYVLKCTYRMYMYMCILENICKYRENSVCTKCTYTYVRSPYVRN